MSNIINNFKKDAPRGRYFRGFIPNPNILKNIDTLIEAGKINLAENMILRYLPNPGVVAAIKQGPVNVTVVESKPVTKVEQEVIIEKPVDEKPMEEAPVEVPMEEATPEAPMEEAPIETVEDAVNEQVEEVIEAPEEHPTETAPKKRS
jgi:hypothetical protein